MGDGFSWAHSISHSLLKTSKLLVGKGKPTEQLTLFSFWGGSPKEGHPHFEDQLNKKHYGIIAVYVLNGKSTNGSVPNLCTYVLSNPNETLKQTETRFPPLHRPHVEVFVQRLPSQNQPATKTTSECLFACQGIPDEWGINP